jgi:hypothetical protein
MDAHDKAKSTRKQPAQQYVSECCSGEITGALREGTAELYGAGIFLGIVLESLGIEKARKKPQTGVSGCNLTKT